VHSNTCSGTEQEDLQFSKVFAGFTGSVTHGVNSSSLVTSPSPSTPVVDNPATSPYPIWQATRPYVKGYKVVRLGEIYEAQWYTQGDDPAAQEANSPWQLIGPVLPGDQAPTTTTLAPGTYPVWSPTTAYTQGQKVLYDGLPYAAKWYNQATSPGAEDANPSSSPWQPLFTVPGEPAGS
jgi:chitinase